MPGRIERRRLDRPARATHGDRRAGRHGVGGVRHLLAGRVINGVAAGLGAPAGGPRRPARGGGHLHGRHDQHDRRPGRGRCRPHARRSRSARLVPGLDELAEIVAVDPRADPGHHFSFADVLAIGAAIVAALADPGTTGVVVVRGPTRWRRPPSPGTSVTRPRPVVVTGAMRNASDPGWDGAANLRAAVRLAVHPAARGASVLVMLGGRVIGPTMSPSATAARWTPSRVAPGNRSGAWGIGGLILAPRGLRRHNRSRPGRGRRPRWRSSRPPWRPMAASSTGPWRRGCEPSSSRRQAPATPPGSSPRRDRRDGCRHPGRARQPDWRRSVGSFYGFPGAARPGCGPAP